MSRPSFFDAIKTLGVGPDAIDGVLDSLAFGVFIDHPELGCTYASGEVLRMFDIEWEQFKGYGWAQAVLPSDMETLREAVGRYEIEKGTIDVQYRITRPSGEVRALRVVGQAILDAKGDQIGSVMIGRDVTAERELKDRNVQSQKLEAIGRLAGRVSHDFNNVLTPILCAAYLLESEPLSPEGHANLKMISEGVQHASGITSQLLGLSRQEVHTARTVRLDHEILQARPLLVQLLGEEVVLELELAADGAQVGLAKHELGQIILNLCVNSRDAMSGVGTVRLCTRQVGAFSEITVSDTGPGIPVDVQQRMFEPFFTTKPEDRGTGLGLSTVKELVERAGGSVRATSALGRGTQLVLLLPSIATASVGLAPSVAVEVPPMRVLLVDDNAALRQTLAFVLALRKHQVKTASTVARAQELLQQEAFDVLVADVLLPDGRGDTLAHAARKIQPDLLVVYISGYVGPEFADAALAEPYTTFLEKPFHPNRLAAALAEVVAARAARSVS